MGKAFAQERLTTEDQAGVSQVLIGGLNRVQILSGMRGLGVAWVGGRDQLVSHPALTAPAKAFFIDDASSTSTAAGVL